MCVYVFVLVEEIKEGNKHNDLEWKNEKWLFCVALRNR